MNTTETTPPGSLQRMVRRLAWVLVRCLAMAISLLASVASIIGVVVELVMSEADAVLGRCEQWLLHEHDDRLLQIEYGGGYLRECRKCGRVAYERR